MDAERWQRIQGLFAAALERGAEERTDFLTRECGDDGDLRGEVESLLRSVSQAGTFVDGAPREALSGLAADAAPPTRLGKYEIIEKIGQGGFGAVYRARDPELSREVAIKTCLHGTDEMRRRFIREGRLAAALRHPQIVAVHELVSEGQTPYLVQEFLAGQDLDRLGDSLNVDAKLEILAQIAVGLGHAHAQGVIHRDIKPSNVRILPGGGVKLLDFGIARVLDSQTHLTATGSALGTIGYLAPEQLSGGELDQRADIFAFGVLAYELMAGRRPFRGETFSHVSYQLLYVDPEPLVEAWPSCPDARIGRLVEQCLEKKPERRPPTMHEIFQELDVIRRELATRDQVQTLQFATEDLPEPPADDRPTLRAPQIGAIAAILLSLAVGWWMFRSPEPAPTAVDVAPQETQATKALEDVALEDETGEQEGEAESDAALETPPTSVADEPVIDEPTPQADVAVDVAEATSSTATDVEITEQKSSDRGTNDLGMNDRERIEAPVASPVVEASPAEDPRPSPAPDVAAPAPRPSSATTPAANIAAPKPDDAPMDDPKITDSAQEPDAAPNASASSTMKLGDHIAEAGPGVTEPQPLETVEPEYPRMAKRKRRAARVGVAVYVDEKGAVVRALLAAPDDSKLGFNQAALDAARRTRFQPATRDGVVGKMWTEIVYTFQP